MAFRDERESHDRVDQEDRYRRIRLEEEARIAKFEEAERAADRAAETATPRRRAVWETPVLIAGGLVVVFALLAKHC